MLGTIFELAKSCHTCTRTKGNRGMFEIAIFPFSATKRNFKSFSRQIVIFSVSRDKSRFFTFAAINRAFSFESDDQIRTFSSKSEGKIYSQKGLNFFRRTRLLDPKQAAELKPTISELIISLLKYCPVSQIQAYIDQ